MKTFKIGGIHPAENKLSAASPIREAALPKQAVFSMFQHIGAPAKPIVKKGDEVKVGTLLAEAGGFVSAPIYSSVSGKVSKVDVALDASGTRRMAVYVDVEGDEWEENIDRSSTLVKLSDRPELDSKTIIEKVKNAGIVGMGGATFPCHVKLSPPPGSKAECVIINAVECEPYLTADHRLMLEHPEEILVGLQLIMKAVDVKKGYIGIENNKPDAIALMTEKAKDYEGIEIVPLKVKYPQGGEKQLIDAVMKRQVKSMGLPIDVGAVVQNVATSLAVYEAVQKNMPLVTNVMTITGDCLPMEKQHNYKFRIGMPLSYIAEYAGGVPEQAVKIISGGPMMGKAIANMEATTVKGSSSLLYLTAEQTVRGVESACIRCGKCAEACPMGLEPFLLQKYARHGMMEELEDNAVQDCIECGCCLYSCPANIPLLDIIRIAKGDVIRIIRGRGQK